MYRDQVLWNPQDAQHKASQQGRLENATEEDKSSTLQTGKWCQLYSQKTSGLELQKNIWFWTVGPQALTCVQPSALCAVACFDLTSVCGLCPLQGQDERGIGTLLSDLACWLCRQDKLVKFSSTCLSRESGGKRCQGSFHTPRGNKQNSRGQGEMSGQRLGSRSPAWWG